MGEVSDQLKSAAKNAFKPENLAKTAIGYGTNAAIGPASIGIGAVGAIVGKAEERNAQNRFDRSVETIGAENTYKLKKLYEESRGDISGNDSLKDLGNGVREYSGFGGRSDETRASAFLDRMMDKGADKERATAYLETSEKYIKANGERDAAGQIKLDKREHRETPYLEYNEFDKIQKSGHGKEFDVMLDRAGKAKDSNPALADKEMVTAKSFTEYTNNRDKATHELGKPAGQEMTKAAHESVNTGTTLKEFNKETDSKKERKAEFDAQPEAQQAEPPKASEQKPERRKTAENASAEPVAAQLAQSPAVKAASGNIQQSNTPANEMPTQNVPAPVVAANAPAQSAGRGPVA